MSRLAVLVISACVLGVGCTGPVYSYHKAGSDAADFRRDSDACVREPQLSSSSGAAGSPMTVSASVDRRRQDHLYRMCMKAHGWTSEAPQ